MPSGTRASIRWSVAPAVTALRSALRALYLRYQRHNSDSPKPNATAPATSTQTIGGNWLSSSTSVPLFKKRAQRAQVRVDFNTLRRPREQFRERLRHRHRSPDERLADPAELGRVRRRHQPPPPLTAGLRRQPLPRLRGGCGVRAPDLAESAVAG